MLKDVMIKFINLIQLKSCKEKQKTFKYNEKVC
jgi:hypothetical protein